MAIFANSIISSLILRSLIFSAEFIDLLKYFLAKFLVSSIPPKLAISLNPKEIELWIVLSKAQLYNSQLDEDSGTSLEFKSL